jgi:transposase
MAYLRGERQQTNLFPASLEEYVGSEDPVRVYDAFVDPLDFQELGLVLDDQQIGPPEFDPQAMLKLLVYGYAYGIRSSRKLERALYHNNLSIRRTRIAGICRGVRGRMRDIPFRPS